MVKEYCWAITEAVGGVMMQPIGFQYGGV